MVIEFSNGCLQYHTVFPPLQDEADIKVNLAEKSVMVLKNKEVVYSLKRGSNILAHSFESVNLCNRLDLKLERPFFLSIRSIVRVDEVIYILHDNQLSILDSEGKVTGEIKFATD